MNSYGAGSYEDFVWKDSRLWGVELIGIEGSLMLGLMLGLNRNRLGFKALGERLCLCLCLCL